MLPMLAVVSAPVALACVAIDGTADPESLGYGSSAQTASGYESDPLPRPAPTPWTPPPPSAAMPMVESMGALPISPEVSRLCTHLASLATNLAESGDDPQRCHAVLRVARVFRDGEGWRALADCIAATDNPEAAASCHERHPLALRPIAEDPRESAACMHIFALTTVEELGVSAQMTGDEIAQFAPLLQECVAALVEEREGGRGPESYATMLSCIEQAPNSSAAEGCD